MSTAIGELRWHGRKNVWQRWSGRGWRPAVYSVDPASLRSRVPWEVREPVDPARRQHGFTQALAAEELGGATVVREESAFAVLAYRRSVSHGLHFLLTVLTGGLWAVVWLAMAVTRREDRVRLDIDRWGHVWVSFGERSA